MNPEVITTTSRGFRILEYFFETFSMKFIPHLVLYKYNNPSRVRFFLLEYKNRVTASMKTTSKLKSRVMKLTILYLLLLANRSEYLSTTIVAFNLSGKYSNWLSSNLLVAISANKNSSEKSILSDRDFCCH